MLLITILLFYIAEAISECVLSTQDLTDFQPLMLKPGSWQPYGNEPYYLPNRYGDITFETGQEIMLHCPATKISIANEIIDSGILKVACKNMRTFQVIPSNQLVPFKMIQCVTPAKHIVRRMPEKCTENNDLLEIGFPLNDGTFLTQITVCFDSLRKRTLYSQSYMTSSIEGFQTRVPRQAFEEGGSFFNLGIPVEQCYYIPRQRSTINQQLNVPSSSTRYIDKGTTIFTRGHLAAKGDFIYGPQQKATFYWINAAPQWAQLNNVNWNDLELSIRSYASQSNKDFIIYTGTHEYARVGNVDLFLHCDEINHIPVPKYYWKVVYEPVSQNGVAFIGLNNPFIAEEQPFCTDVCPQLQWEITWDRKNHNLGLSFCCSVDEFRRFVQFPMFKVTGLLSRTYF